MKTKQSLFIFILFFVFTITACDKKDDETETEPVAPKTPLMLVIVENGIYNDVKSKLATYSNDIAIGDSTAKVIEWGSGSVEALRDTIKNYYDKYHISSALLIGDLPVAWYEMDNSFGDYEEFPCDIFLMDPLATFTDGDMDGIYDYHSTLYPVIGVGRIVGTNSQINTYLDRVHNYRTNGSLTNQSAYLFIDNDWDGYYSDPILDADDMYGSYEVCEDTSVTKRSVYIAKLTSTGAEYVHQMIHSYPSSMVIYIDDVDKEYITTNDIQINNFKASFYNMFNCSGCRYTEENLGMTNVLGTDYGLAVMGTTKTGGNYTPQSFHSALGAGYTWGSAFIRWYEYSGYQINDEWKLGLVLLGDPMLTVSQATVKSLLSVPDLTNNQINDLCIKLKEERKNYSVKGFSEYKASHQRYYSGK